VRTKNDLGRVLEMIGAFRSEGTTRRRFARRHRLHPSAVSRILRVGELPAPLLSELERLPSLSRTHLEVLAAAPVERREELVAALREGRSSYALRSMVERFERRAAPSPALPVVGGGRVEAMARDLGATPEEAVAFSFELLSVLWKTSRSRVEASFESFRQSRAAS
jgi:hypothetical protein